MASRPPSEPPLASAQPPVESADDTRRAAALARELERARGAWREERLRREQSERAVELSLLSVAERSAELQRRLNEVPHIYVPIFPICHSPFSPYFRI